MQGAVAREEVELSFKRYILEKTEAFAHEPMEDLYRVNLLGQMLDRYDELQKKGLSADAALQRTLADYADIPAQMRREGFEEAGARRTEARWPQLTEEEAAARLGDPEEIAKELLRDMPMSELVRSRVRPSGGWTAFGSAGPPQPERAVSMRPPVKSIGRSLLFSAVIDASPFLREGSALCPCSDTVHALVERIHPEPWYLLRRGTVRLCLSGL